MDSLFSRHYTRHFKSLRAITVPRPLRVGMVCLSAGIVLFVLFALFVPWVQTVPAIGNVTAFHPSDRPQTISAPIKGRIRQWFVHEGSQVKKGDPLLEITDNDPRYMERLQLELDAARKKVKVAAIAAETAQIDYHRKQDLFKRGLVSRLDMEKAKIEYNQYLSKQAYDAAQLAKVETSLSRQEAQLVRAPEDGTIIGLRSGDAATFVKEGDIVASFIPAEIMIAVELYVRGLDAPLVTPGAKVRLQFEGWPTVQISGWPSVSVGTFAGIVKSVDPSIAANGKFRILAIREPGERWPDERFLRFGTRAKGWVVLSEVPIAYEWWRQLNDFPPEQIMAKESSLLEKIDSSHEKEAGYAK